MLDANETPSLDGIVDALSMLTTSGLHALLVFLDETSEIQFVGANSFKEAFQNVLVSFRHHLFLLETGELEHEAKYLRDLSDSRDIKPEVRVDFDLESRDQHSCLLASDNSFRETNELIGVSSEATEGRNERGFSPKKDGLVEVAIRKSLRYRPSRKQLENQPMVNEEEEDKERTRKVSRRLPKANTNGAIDCKIGYICKDCGLSFTSKTSLQVHDRIHKGVKPYQCSDCGKCFRAKSNLTVHRLQHKEVKPFSCETCGKGFPRKVNLVEHQRIHTGEKPFKCDSCPAAFSVMQNLKVHRRMHAGARPFQCDQCGRDFPRKANLIIHERSHSKEKPFPCDVCHKTFSQASCLKRHRKGHVGERPQFRCENCGKIFTTKHYLNIHERIHTGEKPFVCDREGCEAAFIGKRYLMLHSKAHTSGFASEEKILSCSRCSLSFDTHHTLHLHLQSCSSDEKTGERHHIVTCVHDGTTTEDGANTVTEVGIDIDVGVSDGLEAPATEIESEALSDGTADGNDAVGGVRQVATTNFYPTPASVTDAPHIILPPQILFSPTSGVFISSTSSAPVSAIPSNVPAANGDVFDSSAAHSSHDYDGYPSTSTLTDSNYASLVPDTSPTSTTIPLAGILISHPRPPPSSSFLLPVDDSISAQLTSSFLHPIGDRTSAPSSILDITPVNCEGTAQEKSMITSDVQPRSGAEDSSLS